MEIKLIDAKKEKPDIGRLVIIIKSNIDNRCVTKSYIGYYKDYHWYFISGNRANNITAFAYLPESITDEELLKELENGN